jgi:fatty-acid peroxygenase
LEDSTLAFLRQGYRFVSERARAEGTDVFTTRILLRPTTCMLGEEAARVFYDTDRFSRHGAMPLRVQKTLLGQGGVQGLDDEAHVRRKSMFLSCLGSERAVALAQVYEEELDREMTSWARSPGLVVLHDAVARVLCRAVCRWSGVPLADLEVSTRTDDLLAMIDAPAAMGARYLRGRNARRRCDAWAAELIRRARAGSLHAAEGSALQVIASHRDEAGSLLAEQVAAVELVNVLRPTVAINRFIVFAALALHEHPEQRDVLRGGSGDALAEFVHEVRRYYPFFPAVVARARRAFSWRDVGFRPGQMALLDLYATNHDPRTWHEPDTFLPDRFATWDGDPFDFVPQGGGDHTSGHRCPGEWSTVEIMKCSVRALTSWVTYDVPDQDLTFPLSRMPTGPRSGFAIERVRRSA